MKLSLSMWSVHKYWYEGRWSTADFLEFAAGTEVQGVELLSIFWRDRKKELPLVREKAGRLSLEIACYCACNNFVAADPAERTLQLKEVTDSIDAAAELGAKTVRVFSGDLPLDGSVSYDTGMQYVLEGLSEAAAYAKRNGIVLCLENHGRFAGRSDQVLSIIRQVGSPALRSAFDTGNFLLVGEDPSAAIEQLCSFVGHVHVKDFGQVESGGPGVYRALNGDFYLGKIAGEGEVDLAHILVELNESGYDGWLSVEFEGAESPREGSEQSVSYVHRLLSALH